MKKLFVVLLALVAVAACDRDENTPVLQCGGYDIQMTITEDGNAMHANINGDELDLVLTPSASGAKYAGNLNDIEVVLWEKSNTWTMMLDEEQIIDCVSK